MAWKDAKTIGEKWADKFLPADLRGQALQLVSFSEDAHARFFYPDRTNGFHAMITNAIARQARKRGAKIVYATITPDGYRDWLSAQGKQDDDAQRLAFIQSCHHVSQA